MVAQKVDGGCEHGLRMETDDNKKPDRADNYRPNEIFLFQISSPLHVKISQKSGEVGCQLVPGFPTALRRRQIAQKGGAKNVGECMTRQG